MPQWKHKCEAHGEGEKYAPNELVASSMSKGDVEWIEQSTRHDQKNNCEMRARLEMTIGRSALSMPDAFFSAGFGTTAYL